VLPAASALVAWPARHPSSPDGYTIAVGQWGTHVINSVIYKLPYDVFSDFEPIGLVADSPFLIVAKWTLPAKDLRELID
jgi:tripartite-type tricarboxylate transporter receptor subunit TctC